MREYHQQYSEIEKMTMDDCMFFMCLEEARNVYEKQEMEKAQQKAKNGMRGFK